MSTKDLIITNKEEIRKQWGKTASDVQEVISTLKQWLETQPHLPEIPDDNTIEFFLTNSKYSIEKTKQNLDMYYTVRTILPDCFVNCHPVKSSDIKLVHQMGHFVALPKQTDSFCRVNLLKYGPNSGDVFDPSKILAYLSNMFEVRLHEDLEMGEIIIFDQENFTMTHALKFNPTILKKFVILVEKLWGNRLKGIHVIKYPPYTDIVVAIAKVVMKKKLYDRIHLHSDMESFYKYVPQDILPSDYGGKEKSLQELTDLWHLKFKEYEKRFDKLEQMTIDEKLRPEPLCNSDILGYHGNFTKLDVD